MVEGGRHGARWSAASPGRTGSLGGVGQGGPVAFQLSTLAASPPDFRVLGWMRWSGAAGDTARPRLYEGRAGVKCVCGSSLSSETDTHGEIALAVPGRVAVSSPRGAIEGVFLDPAVFKPESVHPETLAVTGRLRRAGASAPALSGELLEELRRLPPSAGGVLAAEPPSDLAMERLIDGPAGPVRLRVFRPETVHARYLHVHGGGWAIGGPDRQDHPLLRFARAARAAVVAIDYRLAPEHPHPAGLEDCIAAIR
jgi:alpha/beta hydrolase fold